ncbi:MAG TPA: aerotolerance regulator BatA, partial [Planctomycetaceae bacterium]|nr:aerotolerance regulator BatA [Planctomycetaceae bacterium]
MFRFHSPYWFLLLLPLLGLLVRRYRSRAAATALFSDVRPLRDVPRTRRQRLLFL